MTVLFRQELNQEVESTFQGQNSKLVVLNLSNSENSIFRLVAVYAPIGSKRSYFFKRLEAFLGTSSPLGGVQATDQPVPAF